MQGREAKCIYIVFEKLPPDSTKCVHEKVQYICVKIFYIGTLIKMLKQSDAYLRYI